MKYILPLFCTIAILIFSSCNPKKTPPIPTDTPTPYENTAKNNITKPKNVILMIGDGMGITQITAGLYSNGNKLALEKFPVVGLHKPYAGDNLITDSAAGATAFACGVKTYNGAIGVNMDTAAVETVLEQAELRGMPTGLIATSTIVHATPASFIAHVKQRKMYEDIATYFLKTEVDLMIGGGKKFFDRRDDDRNLYQELVDNNYVVSDYFKQELEEVEYDTEKNFAYFTSDEDPLPVAQGRDYLPIASKMAPAFLDAKAKDNGFFLMIEGSQIDWGGHANNSDYIISEMLDFDKAIAEVLKFAEQDGETLVIVTADHETGGYAINPKSKMGDLKTAFTSDYHTADIIPVFAYGPGAELFGGIYENTAIYQKIMTALEIYKS